MRKILLFSAVFFLLVGSVYAQGRRVTGKVTSSEDGTPLPGVSVVLKGTTVGTATDGNGEFAIEVSGDNPVLTFSFIGQKAVEVAVGARTTIDVQMVSDATELSEVVVTGYGGPEAKRDLTGAVSSIKGAAIANLPVQSFDRAIQGRLAGVQVQSTSGAPGGAINILVRGPGSLTNNTPLYIVDGVQVAAGGATFGGSNNALAGLNPNDIESIEVLKDAAAAAIYGAQSANGVVIITTKRGKAGKSTIDVTYQGGYVQPYNLYDVMNAQQFATIKEAAWLNAGLNPAATPAGAYAIYGNPNDPSTITPMDWVDAVFRTGKLHAVNLAIQGGDEKTTFYVSGNYEKQEGQIQKSYWSRASLRTNFEHKATDKLRVKMNLNLNRQDNFGSIADGNFINGPFQSAFVSQPNSPAYLDDGTYAPYPYHRPVTGVSHNFDYNILQGLALERRQGYTIQTISNVQMDYKIMPWLTAIVSGGVDFLDTEYINERPGSIPSFASTNGSATTIDRRAANWNTFGTLNFAKKFGDAHNVSALVGYEYKSNATRQNTAVGTQFAYPEVLVLDAAATNTDVAGFNSGFKRVGGFVRANYDYKSKYYLNGTFRRDGNSRFGAQNKFGNFYAVGASWRIKEEAFMSGVSILSDLKLRASYGELGNAESIGNFESRTVYTPGSQYNGTSAVRQVIANDLITWERAKQFNLGVDFSFFADRLFGTVEVFQENTEDQLLPTQLPADSGYGSIRSNIGNVLNEGLEIELGGTILDVAGFQYRSSFNITFIRNEVTDLVPGQERLAVGTFGQLIKGEPIGIIEGVPYAGVNPANGKAMWYNIDGEPVYTTTVADRRIIAKMLPSSFGGWTNSFSYKGINLEVFFQYQLGADSFLGDMYNLAYNGSSTDNQLVSQMDYWKEPGDITNVPAPWEGGVRDGYDQRFPTLAPSRYVADASYIRLKQITLGYDLPSSLLSKVGLRKVNVFVQAMNLVTWTKYPGIDPEVVVANSLLNTSTYGNYPNGRQLSFGATVGF